MRWPRKGCEYVRQSLRQNHVVETRGYGDGHRSTGYGPRTTDHGRDTALDDRLFLRIKCAIIPMGRPRSFRNPRRVSLTLNRETLMTARRLARQARRSLSELVSEILDSHFRKSIRSRPRGLA